MRTKNLLLILCGIIFTSIIFIIVSPAGQQNDSLKNIVSQTHQQLKELQENFRATEVKKLDVDQKYLSLLGFNAPIYNGTKTNFSIVTYARSGQAAAAILLSQNIAMKFPLENLLIYDLGLSEDDSHSLSAFCNSSKCSVIPYDLSVFPSHVSDERMHAYRSLIIKDALARSKAILFAENCIRLRGSNHDFNIIKSKLHGVLGWTTPKAVSTRTHPKMFDYFETDSNDFLFVRMVTLDFVFFTDSQLVDKKILLPWVQCTLTLECIDPIGAQSAGCKYNKKPQYRYSGCHAYDVSAFNIVLGLTWHHEESKYSLPGEKNVLFYRESLEQSTKDLENGRRNYTEIDINV